MRRVLILACLTLILSQKPPLMPQQFKIDFNETSTFLSSKGHTNGTIYYDGIENRETVYRQLGSHDRYCGSEEIGIKTPCLHHILNSKVVDI